ncbi:RNA-binding protein NOB1-like [Haliotis rubra]|uniref:RNA-binding protein NOB1-like n=1 Tax=Haliotis rubra TaxID=36100 RepID=UPI001EE55B81|nr:RNA-binding protein NOB1-like [Haliotis rubra]
MATSTKVKHVVADTGAFIRNAPLRDIGEQIYSLPEVIGEIKDKATKQRLQFLPYKLEYREPSAESVSLVTEFSKKTGDYPSLSAVDIRVLALAYQLEKEHVGTRHIKTSPDTKTEINLSTPAPSQPAQIAGFYLGTQSEEQSGCISETIDEVAATLEKQTVTDVQHSSPSPSEVTSHAQQTCVAMNDGAHSETSLKETDKNDFPALSRVPLPSNSTLKTASEQASVQQIYSEIRDDSTSGCPVNNLNDEEEFPTLSQATRVDIISILKDSQETSVVPQVFVEVRDKSGEDNLPLVDEDEYPSLLTQGDSLSEKSITAASNTVSYAKIIQDGQAKVQLKPAAVRVFKEGQVLPSSLIQEGGEEGEESEEEEEEDSDGEEEEDGEGWITPSNIQKVKKQMGGGDAERADVTVGCLTTDFAMQNVLIQMGLNVVSVDGMLIKKAKSYVLRCFACFKVTSKMEKLFCPHCGNHTLKRIAMTVQDDGTIKYFFSRRKKLSSRGLKYSLPTPKGGKHANNPILVADQPFPHQRPTKKSLKSMDVFDPDFMASESPFCRNDVTSRAAQLGIMRQGQNGRRRHQIGVKKSTGRRK